MNKNFIFANKELIGAQLLEFIKGEGYTKASFSRMIDIKKDTLNELLSGKSISNEEYIKTLNKILNSINIELRDILAYKNINTNKISFEKISSNEEILENILDLYEIYC